MIRLVTMYPAHLNLNGDQGNLLVLSKRLENAGINFEQVSFDVDDDLHLLDDADFILIGHGGVAAWRALESELARVEPALRHAFNRQVVMLAVGSGVEVLYKEPFSWFAEKLSKVERTSEFQSVEFEGFDVLGYVNSANDLPIIQLRNSLVATSLHGPVLAKNVKLANWFVSKITGADHAELSLAKADEYADAVLKLEIGLANQ